jgi:P-type Ca2+ transporter type 2C
MITAIVSLALGFYQSFRPGATDKIEWVEGVAILVAIAVITIVQALNDYQQERKFMTLNAKVCYRKVFVLTQIERRPPSQGNSRYKDFHS